MTRFRSGAPVVDSEDLKERDAKIVELRATKQLSYRTIGKQFGISSARAIQIVKKAHERSS